MTDICAAGAAIPSDSRAHLTTRKERAIELRDAASKLMLSRDIFDSLPTVSCDDIEASRGSSLVKTLIGARWYAVDQQGSRMLIETGTFVRED